MNNEQLRQAQADLANGTVDALARQIRAYEKRWTLAVPMGRGLRVLNATLPGAQAAQAAIKPIKERYNRAAAVHNARIRQQRDRQRLVANQHQAATRQAAVRQATCTSCYTVHQGECW